MSLKLKSSASDSVPSAVPTVDTLVERATALRPVLSERARETEASRRVSGDTMDLLAENKLLAMCKPTRFGGYEYGPTAMVRVGYELGQACGSTAWCAMLANSNAWFGSYWPLRAQEEVWGAGNEENLIAAPLAPTGKCVPAEGGYSLWGRWPFASNCENSEWATQCVWDHMTLTTC